MPSSNVKASVLWLGLSEFVNRLSALILLAVASRSLSSNEFADYILFLTFTGLLWIMSHMGTTMHGTRTVCNSRVQYRATIIAGVTSIRLILACFFSAGLFLFHDVLVSGVSSLLVALGIAYVFLRALSVDWVLRAFDMSKYLAGLLAVSSVINGLLGVSFLFYEPSATSLAYAMLFSYSIVCIGTWAKLILSFHGRKFFNCNLRKFGFISNIKKSAAIGLAGIAVIGSQSIPVLSLNWFTDVETVGIFGGLQRILQIMLAPMSILGIAHFPQLVRSLVAGKPGEKFQNAYRHYFSDLFICAIWLTVGLVLFSNWLPVLLLGDRFSGTQPLVIYIALLIPFYYLRTSYSDSAVAMGNSISVLYGCVASLILVLVMSFLLVPGASHKMQLIYSVMILGASEITVLIVTIFFLWKVSGLAFFRNNICTTSTWLLIGGILVSLYLKTAQIAPELLMGSMVVALSVLVSLRPYRYSTLSTFFVSRQFQ